jgi:hypothetical protein
MMISQTDDQREEEVERRAQQRVAQLLDSNTTLPDIISQSVEKALRRVINDEGLRRQFWEDGYKQLESHAGTNAAQWLGRRIWNIIVTAAVAAVLAWAAFSARDK